MTRTPFVPVFDHSTPEGRAQHWNVWRAASPAQRSLIGPPPCFTCKAASVGTYSGDGSPRYDCHLTGRHDPTTLGSTELPTVSQTTSATLGSFSETTFQRASRRQPKVTRTDHI